MICPVCKNERTENRDKYQYCHSCGLLWRISGQTDDVQYYTVENPTVSISESKKHLYRKVLNRAGNILGKTGKVLDVGCGQGAFLLQAKERGWEAVGIEPVEAIVEQARERDLIVRKGVLDDFEGNLDNFELVTYWDVLMIVGDPVSEIQKAASCLSDDGVLYLRIRQHSVLRKIEKVWFLFGKLFGLRNPVVYHPFNFEPRTIQWICSYLNLSLKIENGSLTFGDAYKVGAKGKIVSKVKVYYERIVYVIARFTGGKIIASPTMDAWITKDNREHS